VGTFGTNGWPRECLEEKRGEFKSKQAPSSRRAGGKMLARGEKRERARLVEQRVQLGGPGAASRPVASFNFCRLGIKFQPHLQLLDRLLRAGVAL